jgi:transposase
MILELKRQGLGVSAIARQTGLDRKTVKKYLERGLEAPVYRGGCGNLNSRDKWIFSATAA